MTNILHTGEAPQTVADAESLRDHASEPAGDATSEQADDQHLDPASRRSLLHAERIRMAGRRMEEAAGLTHAEWIEARKAEQDERSRAFYARRAARAAVQRRKAKRLGLTAFAIVTFASIGISTPYLLETYAPDLMGHAPGTQMAAMVTIEQDQAQGYSSYYQASPDQVAAKPESTQLQADAADKPAIIALPEAEPKAQEQLRISATGTSLPIASTPELEPVSPPEQLLARAVSAEAAPTPAAAIQPPAPRSEETRVAALQPSQQPKAVHLPPPPEPAAEQQPSNPAQARPLLERGDELMLLGDIISARALYNLALKMDRPAAAQRLGTTFDPVVFNKLGVRGLTPSLQLARKWYSVAADGGNQEARTAMESLLLQSASGQ